MSRSLFRLGAAAARHPRRVVALWLAVAIAVIAAASTAGGDTTDTFEVPGVDSQLAAELLRAAGDDQAGVTARVVVAVPESSGVGRLDDAADLDPVASSLGALGEVVSVADPAVSADGRVALYTLQYRPVEEVGSSALDELHETLDALRADTGLQVEAGGELFYLFEEPSGSAGELIGIVVAAIVLLLAFGSLLAAALPIGIALFGLAVSISTLTLLANIADVPSWAGQLGAMIGLGVGIDYALFLVTRHREGLAAGLEVEESVGRAVATSGQAIVFAGGTVVVAILGLAVAGVPVMTSGGISISFVVLVMVLAAITLLPALLGLAGRRIQRVRHVGGRRRGGGRGRSSDQVSSIVVGAGWERWGRHVSAHAAAYAVGVTVLLLALTAPVLDLRLGFPDEGTQNETRTERRAYDLVEAGFGPGANGPLLLAIDLSDPTAAADGARTVEDLRRVVAADPGIESVSPARLDVDAGVASFVAQPTTAPQDAATLETVERLRAEVLPAAVDGSDVSVHVGGATATFGDVADRVSDRLLPFILAVIGLSFVLLTVLFRSIVVPIKAALLNLLSIGAAYGVLVAVFQWQWGAGLLGVETAVPIVSFIPMFMFAILFGLSMDYEVFLLSRVREEYVRTGDNERSVITGIATTARVITSAALIMISVFAGFMLGDDPLVKMMGLGLATAILVDATIVRLVLVPATMKLMGDANWWLPRRLERWLPHVDVEGGGAPPTEVGDVGEVAQAGASR